MENTWRKATRSGNDGACVEVTRKDDNILVRDSKHPNGTTLEFTQKEWDAFLDGARKGEFDEI